ncbi:hypothetical protein Taro_022091 [Colocasia esculenta]|uniref:Protein kinase domain-containing protein n=1 Tax=Colocasia esculenta TaxID=4460 RepID=A0A843V0Y1_COLES|nr:hypothetical protein [Colocasia esculenta]
MLAVRPILLLAVLSLAALPPYASAACNRDCGNVTVPYPFGFTEGCPIRINCSAGDDKHPLRIGEYHVRSLNVSTQTLLLDVPRNCSRPVANAMDFFGKNYAMTAINTLLLRNCSSNANASVCFISSWMMSRRLHLPTCEPISSNISCFAAHYVGETIKPPPLLSSSYVSTIGCSSLYSSLAVAWDAASDFASLEFGTVELGWWVAGNCSLCHRNATCKLVSRNMTGPGNETVPTEGILCSCKDGFEGDGFVEGGGCQRRVHPFEILAGVFFAIVNGGCNPSKYMSGSCGGTTRIAVLIGGIVAGAVIMAALGILYYFIRRHSTFTRMQKSTKRLLSEASCTVPLYPCKEIERATNGFSDVNRLGTGAYGTVYVGKLHNNEVVAVKRIRRRDSDGIEQVMNEIKLLSSVSHPNLVRLLGCCIDRGEQILVYEYMPNGTLSQHLQRESSQPGLPWTVRLTIAVDTAKAIAHLHSAIHPPIYHRDIKSSNILLDYNFNSKVADFGLSRMIVTESSHISTAPQGTPGYLDPQYHQNFHLSDKSDVYSFGVVLVEIITALKVVDFNRAQSEINLAALAIDKIGKGCVMDIIDPFLEPHADAWTLSSVHKVAELAFRCLAFHRDMRPSMKEVADELEQIRLSGWAPSDENIILSSASSLCSSPSNGVERSRGASNSKRLISIPTMEEIKGDSPVSVQDSWFSNQSSPSTNSLLGNVIR